MLVAPAKVQYWILLCSRNGYDSGEREQPHVSIPRKSEECENLRKSYGSLGFCAHLTVGL